jgi:hypothetical protein
LVVHALHREQEALAAENDISGMSEALGKLASVSRSAGGFEGEMMRRKIRAADPDKYNAAQTRLAELRQEAMDLVTPVLRRVLVSYSESLAEAAVAAEARLEANGLSIRDGSKVTINSPNANTWVLHEDSVCRALWSCRVKIEKVLFELQPINAIAATQFFLTSEEHTPFSWPS